MTKVSSLIILSALFVCVIIAQPTPTSFNAELENELAGEIERSTRGAVPWAAAGKLLGKLIANAATYTAVAIGVNEIQKQMDKSDAKPPVRESMDCSTNNYGCWQGNCWTNCGPRLQTSDYCVATNGTVQQTAQMNIEKINLDIHNAHYGLVIPSARNISQIHFIPYAKCVTKLECSPCFECAGVCMSEDRASAESE